MIVALTRRSEVLVPGPLIPGVFLKQWGLKLRVGHVLGLALKRRTEGHWLRLPRRRSSEALISRASSKGDASHFGYAAGIASQFDSMPGTSVPVAVDRKGQNSRFHARSVQFAEHSHKSSNTSRLGYE